MSHIRYVRKGSPGQRGRLSWAISIVRQGGQFLSLPLLPMGKDDNGICNFARKSKSKHAPAHCVDFHIKDGGASRSAMKSSPVSNRIQLQYIELFYTRYVAYFVSNLYTIQPERLSDSIAISRDELRGCLMLSVILQENWEDASLNRWSLRYKPRIFERIFYQSNN